MTSLPLYSTPKRNRSKKLTPEARLQITVVEHLRLTGINNLIYWHSLNGVKMTPEQCLFWKRMGMLPGVADLCLIIRGRVHFLELKVKGGRQEDSQIWFDAMCADLGIPYAVAEGIDDALAILRSWGAIRTRSERLAA